MFVLGSISKSNLKGVHPDLVKVVERAITLSTIDFRITEGLRSKARQIELVNKGASKTLNSRHITGHAVDVVALIGGAIRWDWPSLSWVLPASAVLHARAQGAATIDAAAGRARSRYITTVPGQGETYTAKYQEALAYIAAGYPSDTSAYPFIAGESQPNSGMTPTQAATRIATLGGYWREVIGPAIESARINGKDAMDSLTDPAAIDAHVAAVVANLDAI